MSKTLRLVHLANFNSTNIGNGALISGLEHLVETDFPSDIQWIREAWDDYTFGFRQFDRRFVETVNAADGLIVNGAVAIHGREYLRETGMRFELPPHWIDKIRKPVVFYGISYRHFRGQPFHNEEALRKYLAHLTECPNVFFGVRNDGTRKWLEHSLSVPDHVLRNIHEIPDTGVFVRAMKGHYPELQTNRKVIVFAPNDEDAPFRYGDPNVHHARETGYRLNEDLRGEERSEWRKNRERLIRRLKNVFTRVLQEVDAQLVLVPHYFDDLKFIVSLIDSFKPQMAHQSTITTGMTRLPGTADFYGRYLATDLAISMRVHSMSPCIGLGIPMIPLVSQPRMWDFLSSVGLDDLALDSFSEELEKQLTETSLNVLAEPGERKERYRRASEKMREEIKSINTRLIRLFEQSR